MGRELVAPLSPNEETALRRVAYGSANVATHYAERLLKLALVERQAAGLCLTTAGVRRVRSLPNAILEADQDLGR